MTELTQIEREAKQTRDFIAELKGLTPKFNATKERADEELRLHLAKIDGERAKLKELIDAAAVIVQRLGIEAVPEPEPVVAVADSPQDEATTEDVLAAIFEADVEAADEFQSIGEIAAEVTAAVAAIAGDLPATDDQSDAPEMTDEQVERVEESLAANDVRGPKLFNAFAANPFA